MNPQSHGGHLPHLPGPGHGLREELGAGSILSWTGT